MDRFADLLIGLALQLGSAKLKPPQPRERFLCLFFCRRGKYEVWYYTSSTRAKRWPATSTDDRSRIHPHERLLGRGYNVFRLGVFKYLNSAIRTAPERNDLLEPKSNSVCSIGISTA